jgi:hypothetical protein
MIDRYLDAVKKLLPPDTRDDIVKELAALLYAEIDERQTALGRELDEDEQEAVLRRHGHPALVAARYGQERGSFVFGRQWIGPALFPLYTRILKLNIALTVVACIAVAVVLHRSVANALWAALLHACLQGAVLTAIFALANRSLDQFPSFRTAARVRHAATITSTQK